MLRSEDEDVPHRSETKLLFTLKVHVLVHVVLALAYFIRIH